MGREFPLTPRDVPQVATKHRRIVTAIPAPASISRLEQLRTHEPASMGGQPPIIWHEGERFYYPRSRRQPVDRLFGGSPRRVDGIRASAGARGDAAAARDRALPHVLLRERAPDRAGREAGGAGAPAAGEGVPALDGFRGHGVRDQAGADVCDPPQGTRTDAFRHLRECLPRPDHGRPARRRVARAESVDPRQAPRVRPGALPRRVPDQGYLVRPVRAVACGARGGARHGLWRDDRNVPGLQRPDVPA